MAHQKHKEEVPGAVFFAAYVGPSMNPILREPEIMEIAAAACGPWRVGDVVFFRSSELDPPVVHRIIRKTCDGYTTCGDNNSREDALPLQAVNMTGRVVAAWRGQKRRRIAGGLRGRLTRRWLRGRRFLDRGISPWLHPLYQALSRRGWIARVIPASYRPHLVAFHIQDRNQYRLLLGKRIIGHYDERRRQWQIRRPYRLCLEGRMLRSLQEPELLSREPERSCRS